MGPVPPWSQLVAGDRAPLIALRDGEGMERRSDALAGRPLVLFFYPKDDTPGCTAEACAFRDSFADLTALGAEVWGVSGDDAASHQRFAARHRLPFPLLVDSDNALRRAFGVPAVLGLLPGRVTYVIDGEGVIRHVFNNLLDGPAHRREAIEALRRLSAA
jgi:peroxiredoxin Q/BCP